MLDIDRRRIVALAVLGGLAAALIVAVLGYGGYRHRPVQVGAFTTPYDQRVLNDPSEILVVQNDGQAFATLARDPLLQRVEEEFRTPEEAAYRAQRPLVAYAAWALSVGQGQWVAPALVALGVIGGAAAVSGTGALLVNRGASPWFGLLAAVLPGFFFSTAFVCPEPLALGLGAWGVYFWERDRTGPAAMLMAASALTRETMLVGFGVLLVAALWHRRRRAVLAALAPFAAVATWFAVLVVRVGHLPTERSEGRLGWPLQGLLDALDRGSTVADNGNLFYLLVFLVLGVGCLAVARRDHLTWVAVTYLAFVSLSGVNVWMEAGFARTMLPMGAFGFAALVGAVRGTSFARTAGAADEGSSPPRRTRERERGSPEAELARPST